MVRMILPLVIVLAVANMTCADDKAIIAELKHSGVYYNDWQAPNYLLILFHENSPIDAALSPLCELRKTDLSIDVDHLNLTDAQLGQICALPRLQCLGLEHQLITPDRLKMITKARNLRPST